MSAHFRGLADKCRLRRKAGRLGCLTWRVDEAGGPVDILDFFCCGKKIFASFLLAVMPVASKYAFQIIACNCCAVENKAHASNEHLNS